MKYISIHWKVNRDLKKRTREETPQDKKWRTNEHKQPWPYPFHNDGYTHHTLAAGWARSNSRRIEFPSLVTTIPDSIQKNRSEID